MTVNIAIMTVITLGCCMSSRQSLAGRDWKAAAAHVGSRDARQFASHAQKYFIKLCMKGEPLPSRVAESGCGYTLSGKLLDPESAAAKAYGFKEGMLQGESSAGLILAQANWLAS